MNIIFRNSLRFSQFATRTMSTTNQFVGEILTERKLVQLKGDDVPDFLNGLCTNDTRHLTETNRSIYSMFLNVKGRVLYESLLYWMNPSTYLVEGDANAIDSIIKHINMHKLRRKISVSDVSNLYSICFLHPKSKEDPCYDEKLDALSSISGSNLVKDPRTNEMGHRFIVSVEMLDKVTEILLLENCYLSHRYSVGIAEGIDELIPAKCLPLEANVDYLHGVSFQKGCYLGQELTARTYHTGVIRKRFLPLLFDTESMPSSSANFMDENNNRIGKLIKSYKNYGIGLMRIEETLKASSIKYGNFKTTVVLPKWWPSEPRKLEK